MTSRLIRVVLFIALICGLGGLGYWIWNQGRQERKREEVRELSVKVPPRRIVDPKTHEVIICLDRQTQDRLGLAVEPVKIVKRQQKVKLLGYTVQVPDRVCEIRSPWTGILELSPHASMPKVGERISSGQTLGILRVQWSPSDRIQLENQLSEANGVIGETQAEIAVAHDTINRLRKIGDGSVAGKQLPEAEALLAKLEARLTAAQTRFQALQKALDKESEIRFPFNAPQGGLITGILRRPGEVVSAGDLVATIYDPAQIWVTAMVLPGQIATTQVPSQAQLYFPGFSSEPLPAQLVGINPKADRSQQSLEVIYCSYNPKNMIPVGMQAETVIDLGQPHDVVLVPRSAMLQMNERRLIYLKRGEDIFVNQFVEAEDEDADYVYLRPAFPKNTNIVVRGAQSLFSEQYKESIQLIEDTGANGE